MTKSYETSLKWSQDMQSQNLARSPQQGHKMSIHESYQFSLQRSKEIQSEHLPDLFEMIEGHEMIQACGKSLEFETKQAKQNSFHEFKIMESYTLTNIPGNNLRPSNAHQYFLFVAKPAETLCRGSTTRP